MTLPPAHDSPKADKTTHGQGPEGVFDEFISVLGRFCTESGFQGLKAMISDHDRLREELNDTRTAFSKNLEKLTQVITDRNVEKEVFQKKTDDHNKYYKKVLEEKATAYRKLKTEQDTSTTWKKKAELLEKDVERIMTTSKKHEARITELDSIINGQKGQLKEAKEEIATLKSKLQSTDNQLGTNSKALAAAESKLATIMSYTAVMTSLRDVKVEITGILASSFKDASALFWEFLGRDIDEDQLQDLSFWDRVRDHVAIQRAIPIPASNSTQAKQMRATAGLIIYARALTRYVFRPTYFSQDSDAKEMLDALPTTNAFQDTLVRAVLLEVLPDKQRMRQDACAEHVIEDVMAAIVGWVTADRRVALRSRLSNLTSMLCGAWQRVQRLHERVEPCFTFETLDDWQQLPPWIDTVPLANRVKVSPSRQEKGGHQPLQETPKLVGFSTQDIVKVVWPAFLSVGLEQAAEEEEGGVSDLVCHRYVLTRTGVQDAVDEDTPQRAIQRAIRNGNTIAQKNKRDSAVFLSHRAFDRSDVK
ncbi:MEI5 protein [Colletotrichum scovillei]|uniref:MEI5 protein n=1 Tax=Colletotrichum scovillei TaxID=1209932 RepID=A0A9P7QSF6_9PEZI|nr:MEI5 protein [Colletotrichum scovillei]KAG7040627.1 MEI5 protein [Colletotrichum scovillei]KAG7060674.1 MEI5 protein [Colletotrichum scovillei]